MRDFRRSSRSDLDSVVCSACMMPLSSSSRSVAISFFSSVVSLERGVSVLSPRRGVVMVAGRPWCTAAEDGCLVRGAGAGVIDRGVAGTCGTFAVAGGFIGL